MTSGFADMTKKSDFLGHGGDTSIFNCLGNINDYKIAIHQAPIIKLLICVLDINKPNTCQQHYILYQNYFFLNIRVMEGDIQN